MPHSLNDDTELGHSLCETHTLSSVSSLETKINHCLDDTFCSNTQRNSLNKSNCKTTSTEPGSITLKQKSSVMPQGNNYDITTKCKNYKNNNDDATTRDVS